MVTAQPLIRAHFVFVYVQRHMFMADKALDTPRVAGIWQLYLGRDLFVNKESDKS